MRDSGWRSYEGLHSRHVCAWPFCGSRFKLQEAATCTGESFAVTTNLALQEIGVAFHDLRSEPAEVMLVLRVLVWLCDGWDLCTVRISTCVSLLGSPLPMAEVKQMLLGCPQLHLVAIRTHRGSAPGGSSCRMSKGLAVRSQVVVHYSARSDCVCVCVKAWPYMRSQCMKVPSRLQRVLSLGLVDSVAV